MPQPTAAFLWRRLDGRGLDSCRLIRLRSGWRLSGMALFVQHRRVCHLEYGVVTDLAFRAKSGAVMGYFGSKPIGIRCESWRPGEWRVNGVVKKRLSTCIDVDFGFTPATNLLAVRRLDLKTGESGEARAAYFDPTSGRLRTLLQRYERIGDTSYRYEAPTFGYTGILRVSPSGAVRYYPRLFELICES